ncbi:nicotinate phosphoribosyltransferase [Boudabousia liubingyangii]|uniref:Nicotinate phosphoribosyltransferase n=1 Tax=Boudabousia liubingyangii TaxID=1921764 RepID=A0A1Q5PQS0_9ACTO|nr:nicotinate phosphoribosyltransferase [Boudabousia liubingyangii]OKL46072.1 nicotinate phosphoribosyltransferase [Boudabousia liubingyangii]OKL49819.1 nicotinate phosphoribosyltransferase [Boudabousia liubingyangii]
MSASWSTSLLTDMYELTMVEAALKHGTAERRSVFELFGRRLPTTRRFGVVAGTSRILEALERFVFSKEDIDYLHQQKIVNDDTLDFLKDFHFQGNIWGYQEGECYFAGSPLLTVEGTFAEACLLETVLLSILNHDCAVASAASRMTIAAHGRPCLDMGARRTHERAAVSAARASIIGGFKASSDLEAGKRYGIGTLGTSAHSFTLLHETEEEAFRAQVATLGPGTTLLVDTYDIPKGVETAVRVAREAGGELGAVRIDSGDLVAQAFKVRGQLDELGAKTTKITVTSDLDEYAIAALGAAPVDAYGVGTKLVTGSGIPTAALVYKLVEREGAEGFMEGVAKKSKSKSTVAGRKWAARAFDEDGYASEERLYVGSYEDFQKTLAAEEAEGTHLRPLQVKLVTDGNIDRTWYDESSLERAANFHQEVRNQLPYSAWRLSAGEPAIETRVIPLESASPLN